MEEDWKVLKKLKKALPRSLFEQGKDSDSAKAKSGKMKKKQEKILKNETEEDKITVNELKEKLRRKILELRQNGAGKDENGLMKSSKKIQKKGKKNGKDQEGKKKIREKVVKNQVNIDKNGKNEKKKQIKTAKNEKKQQKIQVQGGQIPKNPKISDKTPKEKRNRPGFEGKKSSFF